MGRNISPAAATLLLGLVGMVPLHVPAWQPVTPQLALASVYYWAIHRPDVLRPFHAFLIGIIQDFLGGAPLGLTAFLYVLVFAGVGNQRRFLSRGLFFPMWIGFAFAAVAAGAISWAVVSLWSLALIDPRPVFFQAILSVAAFPAVAWVCVRLHRAYLVVAE